MDSAEDGDAHYCRPPATGAEQDDAVDDAADVRFPYFSIPQRSGSLLGNIEYYYHCHPVLHDRRLGRPGVSKGGQATD